MRRARKKERKSANKLLIFFASFFSVLLIFLAVLGFSPNLFNFGQDGEAEIEEDFVEPVDKATGKVNVLILGVDKDGTRTDVMIVASYDLDENKIEMLNIPRDTRMYIGTRYQKINAAHAISQNGKIKGPQGSIEAVTRLTGIPINYYIEFSCSAFRNTIDALGGVDFDVPQRMKYSDPAQDLYIDLQPGLQHLDGDKAEQFVRFRKYPKGDIARVEAQQKFIKALAEQKLNAGIITKIPDLYKTLQDDILTNITIMDAMKYLPNLKELSSENINMHELPGNFSGAGYDASYWLADIGQLKTLISETFGYDSSNISVDSPSGAPDPAKTSKNTKTTDTKTQTKATAAPTSKPAATKAPAAKTPAPAAKTSAPEHTAAATKAPQSTPAPAATKAPEPQKTEAPQSTPKPEETKKPTKVYGEATIGKQDSTNED